MKTLKTNEGVSASGFLLLNISNRTIKMVDVIISEDRLKTLMKKIFKEEFEKQQKNLLSLISGNFDYHHDRNKESSK